MPASPATNQPGYQQPGYNQPGYGYPGGVPPYPGGPGAGMQPTVSMPGQVVTARVLLFVAGALWALLAVLIFFVGLVANDAVNDIPGVDAAGGAALGVAFFGLLIFGGLAALHIVPASMFGKGRIGTRVTAIIAASVNALLPLLGCFGALGSAVGGEDAASIFFWYILWLATAVGRDARLLLPEPGESVVQPAAVLSRRLPPAVRRRRPRAQERGRAPHHGAGPDPVPVPDLRGQDRAPGAGAALSGRSAVSR